MSETEAHDDRDLTTGRFLPGNSGCGGGRPRGQRNRLGEAFLEDLRDTWERHGAEALERCAVEDPVAFVRTVAGLMPRDINLNLGIDVTDFAGKFKAALEALHGEPVELPVRPMRTLSAR